LSKELTLTSFRSLTSTRLNRIYKIAMLVALTQTHKAESQVSVAVNGSVELLGITKLSLGENKQVNTTPSQHIHGTYSPVEARTMKSRLKFGA
jgi:hypothetical protein